jgi:hypothetical protein
VTAFEDARLVADRVTIVAHWLVHVVRALLALPTAENAAALAADCLRLQLLYVFLNVEERSAIRCPAQSHFIDLFRRFLTFHFIQLLHESKDCLVEVKDRMQEVIVVNQIEEGLQQEWHLFIVGSFLLKLLNLTCELLIIEDL